MPGLLDRSCCPRQATRLVVGGGGVGRGRMCVATADFGIMFGEPSGLTVVILAGNFSGANEALVRKIPWLN